ncbi:MAG: class I SAM-dependent methyltransferase [Nitrospinae bacterium]|nr:class I SAM-dependent methyltransferase [Nitrospinota bacterium]
MTTTLTFPEALVHIAETGGGKRRVSAELLDPLRFISVRQCETAYPLDLIQLVLDVKGPLWVCDEIARDEDENYVQKKLRNDLLGYLPASAFASKTILDFGCGSGASTVILGRMFPDARIAGVELDPNLLRLARARAEFHRLGNATFHRSPDAKSLPDELAGFDFAILSAVYEHLLPDERRTVLPEIWARLKPGGTLFIDQTPYRYFPVEAHATGLPLINYLPDRWAHKMAVKFSRRVASGETWEGLLRKGIRGGSEREIQKILRGKSSNHPPILLEPGQNNLRDRIDLWYSNMDVRRYPRVARMVKYFAKTVQWLTGAVVVHSLSLAIRKPADPDLPPCKGGPRGI